MSSSPDPNTGIYATEIAEIQNAETLDDLKEIAKGFTAQMVVKAGGALYGALETKTETILEQAGVAPAAAAEEADGFVNQGRATVDPTDPNRPWAPIDPDFPRNPNFAETTDPSKAGSESGPEIEGESGEALETLGKAAEGVFEGIDIAKTLHEYGDLESRGNEFAATDLIRTKALEIGGGFLADEAFEFSIGTGAGAELGPFAPVAGLAASVAGVFGGKAIADHLREDAINVNTGADGKSYEYKDGRWQSYDLLGSVDGFVSTPASPEQIPTLEMQRASKLTSLAIANPPTLDENAIDATDPATGLKATWTRVGTSAWETRAGAACDVVAASPKLTSTLNAQSALIHAIGSDGADYVAKGYVSEFYGKGWNTIGTLPDSVTTQLHLPSENNITDPITGDVWSVKGNFVYRDASTLTPEQRLDTLLQPLSAKNLSSTEKALQEAGLPNVESYTEDTPSPADTARILAIRDAAVKTNNAYGVNLLKQETAALDAPPATQTPSTVEAGALPGCAPVAPSAGVAVSHLPGAILPAAPAPSTTAVPDPEAETAPTPPDPSKAATVPAASTPTVTPTATATPTTPTGLAPVQRAAIPAAYVSPDGQGGPVSLGDAAIAAVQSGVDRMREQGTILPDVASVQPYTPRAQTGSFVPVSDDTVAQHLGRGQYQVASVTNDLGGAMPPVGRPVALTPQGQVPAPTAVATHISSRAI